MHEGHDFRGLVIVGRLWAVCMWPWAGRTSKARFPNLPETHVSTFQSLFGRIWVPPLSLDCAARRWASDKKRWSAEASLQVKVELPTSDATGPMCVAAGGHQGRWLDGRDSGDHLFVELSQTSSKERVVGNKTSHRQHADHAVSYLRSCASQQLRRRFPPCEYDEGDRACSFFLSNFQPEYRRVVHHSRYLQDNGDSKASKVSKVSKNSKAAECTIGQTPCSLSADCAACTCDVRLCEPTCNPDNKCGCGCV